MPKGILSIILLLAPVVASAQTIDYTTVAIPLPKAMAEIGRQSGQKLFVSDELSNEPVVLRLKNVPIKDVMDKLGDEFIADWVKVKDGLELRRTPERVEAFEKEFQARRLKAFQDSINKLAPLADTKPVTQDEAKQIASAYVKMLVDEKNNAYTGDGASMRMTLSNRTGDMRLLALMVKSIGAVKLASLPAGVTVFAPTPTPTQIAVPGISRERLAEYVQERNTLADAINAVMPNDVWDGYGNSAMFAAKYRAKGPVKPLLAVNADPSSDSAWVTLSVYDSDGKELIELGRPFANSYVPEQIPAARAKATLDSKNEQAVKLSALAVEFGTRDNRDGKTPPPLSPAAVDFLLDPEDHDPLSLGFSEMVLADAENQNRNLIASSADSRFLLRAVNGEMKPTYFEQTMTAAHWLEFDRPDGWLLVHSANPILDSANRCERNVLGKFARAWGEKGYESIEDWAEVAAHQNFGAFFLALQYERLLSGLNQAYTASDFYALRLYGLLSEEQRGALASGGTLAFNSLSSDEQECLQKLVYQESSLRKAMPLSQPGRADYQQAGYPDGVLGEPTESVPDGIPASSQLSATMSQTDQFFMYTEGDMAFNKPVDINELANTIVLDQLGRNGGDHVSGVRYGVRRQIVFDLGLTDQVKMESALNEDQLPKGEPIPINKLADQLPPEAWTKLKGLIDEYRKRLESYKNLPPPREPGTPPPPQAA